MLDYQAGCLRDDATLLVQGSVPDRAAAALTGTPRRPAGAHRLSAHTCRPRPGPSAALAERPALSQPETKRRAGILTVAWVETA